MSSVPIRMDGGARSATARQSLRGRDQDEESAAIDPWMGGKVPLAGLAIAGLIVVGMVLDSRLLLLGGTFVALAGGVVYPPLAMIVLATMGPLRMPLVLPAPGFNVALAGAALVGCLYRLPVDRTRIRVSPALVALGAFVIYAFLQQLPQLLSGYDTVEAHDIGYLFYQLGAGFGTVLVAGFVLRGRSPYPVFAALLLSATFAAALAALTTDGAGGALRNLIPPSDIGSRTTGPFGNPNNFGQLLAYGIVLATSWFSITRSPVVRWGLIAISVVLAYGLVLSLSRGAAATCFVGLVALAFGHSRRAGLAVAVAGVLLVAVGYPLFVQFRLAIDVGSTSASALAGLAESDAGRLGAVLAGPALFATSPVFGIGFGQYKYMSALVSDSGAGLVAHNWYGTVLAEQGIIGIVLWALLLIAVASWLRTRPVRPRTAGFAMFAAAIVGCMFLEPPTQFQTGIIPAVTLTAALVANWGEPDPVRERGADPAHRRSTRPPLPQVSR